MTTIIRKASGLAVALSAAYCIWDYPVARLLILAVVLLYAGLLYKNRRAWLVVVPALLPVSDLTLYSGRLMLSEFDILLMTTLAVLLLRPAKPTLGARPATSLKLPKLSLIAIGLLALSFLIGVLINLSYPIGEQADNFSSYHSPANALRVAKGFFWAMLLWPFLWRDHQDSPEKTRTCFVTGLMSGLMLAGVGILWERGVIDSLVHWQGPYQILGNLLDFSTTYRITGLFSAMHVGGTAIDGYLIMVIPFCLYAFLARKSPHAQVFSALCLLLGIYGVMVTFSRGLYGGFLVATLLLTIMLCRQYLSVARLDFRKIAGIVAAFVVVSLYMVFLFINGGYGATLGAFFLLLATLLATAFLRKPPRAILFSMIGGIFLVGSYLVFDSLVESKWRDNSIGFSAATALVTGVLFTVAPYRLTAARLSQGLSLNREGRRVALFSLVAGLFWLAVIPPLLNTRMEARFSTLDEDFSHRAANWRSALAFREPGLLHSIFGTGVGSFPRYYFFNHYNGASMVHYRYGQEDATSYLALGGGDFNMTQKIALSPRQSYLLRVRARGADGAFAFSLKMCKKHILYSDRYVPQCVKKSFRGTGDGEWRLFEAPFNSGQVGQSGIFNWPVTLMIHNSRDNSILDLTDIEIIDSTGQNLVSNGDFRHKNDRWIMIRDFSHDAWHAKNIFIHLMFEQGYFGLLAFVFLIGYALTMQYRAFRRHDPLAPLLIAAICGTLVVGLFGTIIDNPRVTTLYFLIIFFALLNRPRNQNSRNMGQNIRQNMNTG